MNMSSDAGLILALADELWEKAREEAKKIIEDAKLKASQIIREAEKKAEALKSEKMENLRTKIRKKLYREYAVMKLELRRQFTVEKSKIIQSVLNDAIEKVYAIVEKRDFLYVEALKKLSVEAVLKLYSEDVILYCCSERDKEILQKIINDVIDEVSRKGKKVKVRVAEELLKCKGGVLAVSTDGREYYNNTLEARIKRVEEEVLPEILLNLTITYF